MKLIWATDIHLDHASGNSFLDFFESINYENPHCVLISGDIAEGNTIVRYLEMINDYLNVPIYFVLGNHCYYNSSIKSVRKLMKDLTKDKANDLHWMNASGVISLNKATALIGHDGWADGRNGDWNRSSVMLNDYYLIDELARGKGVNHAARKIKMEALADEAADYLEKQLNKALQDHDKVIALTHVPPFKGACWHEGKISNWEWLPHFSNAVVGPRLAEVMLKHPDKHLTILCGHTHSSSIYKPIDNLIVKTGSAVYGKPHIQEVINI